MGYEHNKHSPTSKPSYSSRSIVEFTHLFLAEMEALAEELFPDWGSDTDTIVHDVLFSSLVFRMIISQGFTKTEFIGHFYNELDYAIALHKEFDEEDEVSD